MSTQHSIYDSKEINIEIDEQSDKFDLVLHKGKFKLSVDDISPEDMAKIAVRLLEVSSYYMEHTDLHKIKQQIKLF